MTTNLIPTSPGQLPITCQHWCTDGTGHADELHREDQACLSEGHHIPLSHHHYMDERGVSREEADLGLVHCHGETTVELGTPRGNIRMTTDEARALHASLGQLLDLHDRGNLQ